MFFAIVPILVCGFIYLNSHPRHRLQIGNYHGWLIYFHAVKFGLVIVFLSFVVFEYFLPRAIQGINYIASCDISEFNLISYVAKHGLSRFYTENQVDTEMMMYARAITLSIISVVFAFLVNVFFAIKRRLNEDILWQSLIDVYSLHSQVDYLFCSIGMEYYDNIKKPFAKRKLALITLDSRKVYIGIPHSMNEPNETSLVSESISFIPVYSGYRCEKCLGLKLVTDYAYLLEKDSGNENRQGRGLKRTDTIAITKNKISSISAFTMNSHYEISKQEERSTCCATRAKEAQDVDKGAVLEENSAIV
ncbi:hypothetical protein [Cobetia marina]|uniref:hypothetical protein n=1 Tax=Cobetia marina TaxID=28258 RepID=UPI00384E7155